MKRRMIQRSLAVAVFAAIALTVNAQHEHQTYSGPFGHNNAGIATYSYYTGDRSSITTTNYPNEMLKGITRLLERSYDFKEMPIRSGIEGQRLRFKFEDGLKYGFLGIKGYRIQIR